MEITFEIIELPIGVTAKKSGMGSTFLLHVYFRMLKMKEKVKF